MNARLIGLSALFLAGCGGPGPASFDPDAEWRLVGEESALSLVSIKAGEIGETHTFGQLSGTVLPDGAARVEIALNTIDTGIDVRDERMKTMLFETETYPTATLVAEADFDSLKDLAPGARMRLEAVVTVELHGARADYDADLFVTRIGPKRALVETAAPIIVYASDLDLDEGVEALREVAGLPSISPAVPVTVSFVFEQ